jgi:flap endonuclease-1
MGILYRNLFFIENGIKPCWVFDGAPPEEKKNTLLQRQKIKAESMERMKESAEDGEVEDVKKFAKRAIYVTKTMTNDAKRLIQLLGLPMIEV